MFTFLYEKCRTRLIAKPGEHWREERLQFVAGRSAICSLGSCLGPGLESRAAVQAVMNKQLGSTPHMFFVSRAICFRECGLLYRHGKASIYFAFSSQTKPLGSPEETAVSASGAVV